MHEGSSWFAFPFLLPPPLFLSHVRNSMDQVRADKGIGRRAVYLSTRAIERCTPESTNSQGEKLPIQETHHGEKIQKLNEDCKGGLKLSSSPRTRRPISTRISYTWISMHTQSGHPTLIVRWLQPTFRFHSCLLQLIHRGPHLGTFPLEVPARY